MEQLSIKFLNELYKLCLYKIDVIEIVKEHLQFSFIPNELKGYKKILKDFTTYYKNNNKLPTIGIISQINQNDVKIQEILHEISDVKLPEKKDILIQFESFIKKAKFQDLYYRVADIYNSDDRQEEAINILAKESEQIANFCIYKNSQFENIFEGFHERQKKRDINRLNEVKIRIPFGVTPLDERVYGGSEETETDLFIARSGGGKTTWLIWRAISASRRGHKVLYISAEGAKEMVEKKIDAAWTALSKRDIEFDNIDHEFREKLQKVINDILNKKGEISVVAYEQFDTVSMLDVRNIVIDYIKINGTKPDLICLDYLEKFNPGDGKRYSASMEGEKMRREATADRFKNICTEFKIRGATATQSTDIEPKDYNNPDFVMTRHNVSGAKGLVNSFSYVFTFNQTNTEYSEDLGRIYCDKIREYKAGGDPINIATQFNKSRFYDHKRTIKLFYEE